MNWLKNINFKIILIALFLLFMGLIFFINGWLMSSLRESVSKTAKSYQVFIQGIASQEELGDYPTIQLFNKLLTETDIPIVIKNISPDEIYTTSSHFDGKSKSDIRKSLVEMEQNFNPLLIKVTGDKDCQGSYEKTIFNSEDIVLSPNPTNSISTLYVGGDDNDISLSMFDNAGRLLWVQDRKVNNSRSMDIVVNNLKAGTYYLKVESKTVRKTAKLIKN